MFLFLVHVHAAHASCACSCGFGNVCHQRFGGQSDGCNGCCVFDCGAANLGGVYDAHCQHIAVNIVCCVIAVVCGAAALDLIQNNCAFYTAGGMAPQRGRICMDMCMVDLTELPGANVDSPVEIFGEHVSPELLARQAGTIAYELLCSVSKRVPRVYGDEGLDSAE